MNMATTPSFHFHLHIKQHSTTTTNCHVHVSVSPPRTNNLPNKLQTKNHSHPTTFNINQTKPKKTNLPNNKHSISSVTRLLSYANSGRLEDALQMFDTMSVYNTFIWNMVIKALTDNAFFEDAVMLFCRMQFEGIKADKYTFPFVIKACVVACSLKEGETVHSMVIKLGLDVDIYVCNALIVMYAKLGRIESSERVFGSMVVKDLVSWNSMMSGYGAAGEGFSSLLLVREMLNLGLKLDRFSVNSALNACAMEKYLLIGKEIHCFVLKNGFESDITIQTSLIDMYGKCGVVNYDEALFDRVDEKNIVMWNSMISSYAANCKCIHALSCVQKMCKIENVDSDIITLINVLPACAQSRDVRHGKEIHGRAIRKGYVPHLVLETALLDMYGKCGDSKRAKQVLHHMEKRNLVTWNSLISAYAQNGPFTEAIRVFHNLRNEPFSPDEMTFSSILPAFAEKALPKEGKQIHSLICKLGFDSSIFVSNALIHMYAKCDYLEISQKIFDSMSFKDVVSWNVIIMAYAIHGLGSDSIKFFSLMREKGIEPNASTFVSVLSACSIAGLSDQGWKFFSLMKRDHRIDPGIEHYGCMLDLLGRSGNLGQAKRFIDDMPLAPTSRIWGSLLVASRHHKNIELAELAADKILALDSDNTGCYVLLANMYAELERWEDVERVKCLMKKRGLERTEAHSMVECNGKMYRFTNHDLSKTDRNTIYEVLHVLMKKLGEDMDVSNKFKPLDLLRRREKSPKWHSVRVAICSGLINTSVGKPLLIRKNVRMCESCHDVVSKISKITNREIVVGDSKIYHHFKDGNCSCRDYW